jgi:hypothetical protein
MGDWEIRRLAPVKTNCTCRICLDLREQAEQVPPKLNNEFSGMLAR